MMMASSSSLPGTSGFAGAAAAERPVVKKWMWTEKEDEALREQVRLQGGPHNWDAISAQLAGRTAKSCRLRWCQHLDPRVDADKPFTAKEDLLIVKYQALYGNRWSTIAEFLSGRTDNAIKNRWNSVLRKKYAGDASAAEQGVPRQHWAPNALPRAAVGAELTPGCLPLFPLESGDVRMDGRGPPLPPHAPEDGMMSEDETSAEAAPMELFPLAPGDVRVNSAAAASSDMSCGANDPLTQLRLAPPARMVFDVMPIRAYRM